MANETTNESVGLAIMRAAEELPEGWMIEICVERGAGWAVGHDAEGNEHNTESGLPDAIHELIEIAKSEKP